MIKDENKLKKKAQKIRNHFEDSILSLLDGMGEIIISRGEKTSYLLKNNIIFAKLIDNAVYFISPDSNEYEIVPDKILENKDSFLMQATKSYFHVKKEQDKFTVA